MLDIFRATIIGIVEGITEFLPISSTGHIDLVSQFVQISQGKAFEDMFEYVIQFGAIMAVVILYFSKLNPFSFRKSSQEKKDTWTLWFKVIVACIPSIVIGFPLNNFMDEHLHKPVVVASALIIYGIFFIIIENIYKNKTPKVTSLASIGYNTALYIGLFQALSIVPGTSRSGATILGAIILGASRYVATEFSFFLAIPTMFGVTILKVGSYLLKGHTFTGEQWAVLATGTFVSFIIAVVAIKWLLKFVQTHDFKPFGWYRIVVGIIVLIAMVWL